MFGDSQDVAFLASLRVLYVEDDTAAREATGEFLRRRVGQLTTAKDGAEGLIRFLAGGADLVITDILMPNMDGLAMAAAIRERGAAVPIVVTTAFEQADFLARAIQVGIDHYVLKPIQADRFEFALLSCTHRLRLAASAGAGAAGEGFTGEGLTGEESARLARLTARELQILACLGRGLPPSEIGLGLGISQKTVYVHLAHVMSKLGLHKSTALAVFAVRAGLLRVLPPEAVEPLPC
jgi:DNA-binding NarL/FixJ family response regulator